MHMGLSTHYWFSPPRAYAHVMTGKFVLLPESLIPCEHLSYYHDPRRRAYVLIHLVQLPTPRLAS